MKQQVIPSLLEDQLEVTLLFSSYSPRQNIGKLWFLLQSNYLQIQNTQGWQAIELKSISIVDRISSDKKRLFNYKEVYSFIIQLQGDTDLMLIRCDSREQRVKWMEGLRGLVYLSTYEMPSGEFINPIKSYSALLISNTRQAVKLTSKFRGIAKTLDIYPKSTLPQDTKNLGKLVLISIGIVIQVASSPFHSKTSQGEFNSCLNTWLKSLGTILQTTGENITQLQNLNRKIEELLGVIMAATRPTISIEMSFFMKGILENIKDVNQCLPGTAKTLSLAKNYAEQFSNLLENIKKNTPPQKYKSLQAMARILWESLDNLFLSYMEFMEGKDPASLGMVQNHQQKVIQQVDLLTQDLEDILGMNILNINIKL